MSDASLTSKTSACLHRTLRFASGDYYLICQDCLRYWVMTDGSDVGAPHKANIGEAAQLSGQVRTAESENDGN